MDTVWTHVVVNLLTPIGSGDMKQTVDLPTHLATHVLNAAARIGLSKVEFIRRAAVSAALHIEEDARAEADTHTQEDTRNAKDT